MVDLIISRKRLSQEIAFTATNEKGEEFLQMYCVVDEMVVSVSVALNYKKRAEELGLTVQLLI